VVITYPGFVLGPHDPHLSEGMRMLRDLLKGRYPIVPSGGFPIVDVRDVAAVHAAVLEPGRGPRRYLASGTNAAGLPELMARLGTVTGRRLPAVTMPAGLLLPVGRAVQVLQRIVPFHIPAEFEGIYVAWCAARYDDTRTQRELGVAPRDLQATLADTVRWLVDQGHISPRQGGQLATPDTAVEAPETTRPGQRPASNRRNETLSSPNSSDRLKAAGTRAADSESAATARTPSGRSRESQGAGQMDAPMAASPAS
jgi:dihydroflavonol-4-reductase